MFPSIHGLGASKVSVRQSSKSSLLASRSGSSSTSSSYSHSHKAKPTKSRPEYKSSAMSTARPANYLERGSSLQRRPYYLANPSRFLSGPINNLDNYVLGKIVTFLICVRDLAVLAQVSKRFAVFANHDELWKRMCSREDQKLANFPPNCRSWKQLFLSRFKKRAAASLKKFVAKYKQTVAFGGLPNTLSVINHLKLTYGTTLELSVHLYACLSISIYLSRQAGTYLPACLIQ